MQKIEAVIRPEKILDVKAALEGLGYGGMTVTEVKGHGNQRGVIEKWKGEEFWIEFLPKIWFIVVVDDKDVEAVIDAICDAATTGEPGDGKIFISDVREAVRVRTRERGVSALTGGTPVHASTDG
jgi:nitrogen regulatory protein P-II 1